MSNSDSSGFGQFVPGFEFLQKLAQGGQTPMSGWLAPTLDPKALDKRIEELKAVQFWLDQNATALKATLQALEVQKMTLAALGSMNVNLNDLAAKTRAAAAPPAAGQAAAAAPGSPPDPLQYWGALTRQFQQIAASALQDVAARSTAAPPPASTPAAPAKKPVRKPASAARAPARKKSA